jgi:parallel beta-helix repeat protein
MHTGIKASSKSISGVLKKDTTLSGRIEVNGDLLVPAGVTLSLQPGTELIFLPARNSRVEPRYLFPTTELLVRGTLKSQGTQSKPIRFTSSMEKSKAWAGIILDHSSGDVISNTVIEYANGGIFVIGSSPKITDNQIAHTIYGIVIRKNAQPEIKNNLIKDSRFGIFLGPDARMIEQNNRFESE